MAIWFEKNMFSGQAGPAWYMTYILNKSVALNLYFQCVFYGEQEGHTIKKWWKGGEDERT